MALLAWFVFLNYFEILPKQDILRMRINYERQRQRTLKDQSYSLELPDETKNPQKKPLL